MDNFIEDQRAVNVQGNQEIEAVENSLNKEFDVFHSEIDQEFDILHQSISHQEEELKVELAEAPEELQDAPESCVVYGPWRREEEILPLLTEEAVEEHQDHNLPLPPIDSMYILPTPAACPTPETPSPKVIPFALPWLHNLRKLVVITQTFATTSKKMAAAHTAWHSRWFGCGFRHGAPEPRHC